MNQFRKLSMLTVCVVLLFHPLLVRGADKKPTVADAAIDLAVPDSPAFAVLGLSPNNILRPASPREFATQILNGVDANGNFQTGVAIEAAPYLLIHGADTYLEDYQTDRYKRFLSRTMLSFATAKGATSEDKSVKLAIGLNLILWDEGDPRLDNNLLTCLRDAVRNVEISKIKDVDLLLHERNLLQKQAALTTDPDLNNQLNLRINDLQQKIDELEKQGTAELNEKSSKAITACRNNDAYRSNLWNKSSWSIGVAPTFTSATGNSKDLNFSGVGVWSSVAFRLGDSGQAILYASYRSKEQVPDPNIKGQFIEQASAKFGGRLRYGSPNINGNIEGIYIIENRENGQPDDKIFRYDAGLEYNLAKDFWITFNVGNESGNNSGNKLFVLSNLKWAFSPKPTMKF